MYFLQFVLFFYIKNSVCVHKNCAFSLHSFRIRLSFQKYLQIFWYSRHANSNWLQNRLLLKYELSFTKYQMNFIVYFVCYNFGTKSIQHALTLRGADRECIDFSLRDVISSPRNFHQFSLAVVGINLFYNYLPYKLIHFIELFRYF